MNLGRTDHVEVTIDDLFIEEYTRPAPPKVSSAMKMRRRRVPHPTSLLGLVVLGGLVLFGAGLFARYRFRR